MAAAAPLWPWLAVAAAGALHGLNPMAGWGIVAWRQRKGGKAPPLRALAPIALGNVLSVLIVAAAVPLALEFGRAFDPLLVQGIAAALLLAVAARHALGHALDHAQRAGAAPQDRLGLALWAFIVGTAHGAGWMLVPAIVPLCASGMPGREIALSGSVVLALAAVGVHLGAMLLTTAAASAVAWRALRALRDDSAA